MDSRENILPVGGAGEDKMGWAVRQLEQIVISAGKGRMFASKLSLESSLSCKNNNGSNLSCPAMEKLPDDTQNGSPVFEL